jgi:archaellum component FlaC
MSDPYWFFKKWGLDEIPTDSLLKRIEDLENRYEALLRDVVRLEEENIESTNLLYELSNNIEAVDRRIDILAEKCGCITDV